MKNIFKSWKTTIIGLLVIVGLLIKAYFNAGFLLEDLLIGILGIGFIITKDANKSHYDVLSSTVDPIRKFPDERG